MMDARKPLFGFSTVSAVLLLGACKTTPSRNNAHGNPSTDTQSSAVDSPDPHADSDTLGSRDTADNLSSNQTDFASDTVRDAAEKEDAETFSIGRKSKRPMRSTWLVSKTISVQPGEPVGQIRIPAGGWATLRFLPKP